MLRIKKRSPIIRTSLMGAAAVIIGGLSVVGAASLYEVDAPAVVTVYEKLPQSQEKVASDKAAEEKPETSNPELSPQSLPDATQNTPAWMPRSPAVNTDSPAPNPASAPSPASRPAPEPAPADTPIVDEIEDPSVDPPETPPDSENTETAIPEPNTNDVTVN